MTTTFIRFAVRGLFDLITSDSKGRDWEGARSMLYRLAALPYAWMDSDTFILEDRVGGLYLFEADQDRLERLNSEDANLLMSWYELSQSFTWHSRVELVQMLTLNVGRQDRVVAGPVATRQSRSETSTYATVLAEPIDDQRFNAGI